MVYGHEHGALRWAPLWVRHSICHVWNKVHCAFAGHDRFGYEAYTEHVIPGRPVCSNCCAPLKIDGRYPTDAEIESHNELCHKGWEEAEAQHKKDHPEFYDAEGNPKDIFDDESREGIEGNPI